MCVFCTFHISLGVDSSEKRKLGAIEFYNKTKSGVDATDQMARQYSVKVGTHRWPDAVFCNILDLACINAFVSCKERTGDSISSDITFKLATNSD